MIRRFLLAVPLVLAAPAVAQPSPARLVAEIGRQLDASYPRLDALNKDIHAHPELGFGETRTGALLAKEMRALGFEVTEGIGGTGPVAIYRNAGVAKSLYFTVGVHDPAKVAAAEAGGEPLPYNHNPYFAPVPEPTIRTGVTAMTLAVLHTLPADYVQPPHYPLSIPPNPAR